MINRIRYYLNEKDDNFEIKIQSATLLRKLFLSMTYENFVNVNTFCASTYTRTPPILSLESKLPGSE